MSFPNRAPNLPDLANPGTFLSEADIAAGSGALTAVAHDGTMTGDGTSGSPLSVVASVPTVPGWYVTQMGPVVINNFPISATKLSLAGFVAPAAFTVAHGITISVGTVDAAHNYAFGLYDHTGALVLHTAPAAITSTGIQTLSVVETLPLTFQAALYFIGFTGAAATALLIGLGSSGDNAPIYALDLSGVAATVPGQMNASITPMTRNLGTGGWPWFVFD